MKNKEEILNNLKTLKTKHFVIHYSESNKILAEIMLKKLDSFFERLNNLCHSCPDDDCYDLVFVDNIEDFIIVSENKKGYYEPWMKGHANKEEKRIEILRPNTPETNTKGYLNYILHIVLHEVVHMVFNNLYEGDTYCTWISEGTAIHYSNQLELKRVKLENHPSIEDIVEDFSNNGGYTYAGVYVGYLIKLLGEEEFVKQYKTPKTLHHYIYDIYEGDFETDAIKDYLENLKEKE